MPCYSPLRGQRQKDGRVRVVDKATVFDFSLPCGRCIGCRLHYSQMWAIRCVHEASLWDLNCCVTLTYDEEHLPAYGNLVYRDFQLFLKRLRKRIAPATVRFFCGGEYGDVSRRPHFHALLFGYDFPDKVVYSSSGGRARLWSSDLADRLWRFGRVVVGVADFDSAAYIARYMVKKMYGEAAKSHYEVIDEQTGEVVRLSPEFAHMSLRPGIGRDWCRLYWRDITRSLKVVSRGREVSLPRAYARYVGELAGVDDVKHRLRMDMNRLWRDNTPARLKDKERVAAARLGLSRRVL